MIIPKIAIAINYIDDDLICEAADFTLPAKKRSTFGINRLVVAVCLVVVLIGAAVLIKTISGMGGNRLTAHELKEIEEICGSDPLLEAIVGSGDFTGEYVLEVAKGGAFENSADWDNLTVRLCDDNEPGRITNLECTVVYNDSAGAVDAEIWDNLSFASNSNNTAKYTMLTTAQLEQNGIKADFTQNYHGYTNITYAGKAYYVSTHSDDPDFFDRELVRKLIYGDILVPDEDLSKYTIDLPDAKLLEK